MIYRAREVLKHTLETKKWDWELYEKVNMRFVRGVLPEEICSSLRNALLKKEVAVISKDFHKAFTGLFMLVSPLNNPAYNDVEVMYSLTETLGYVFYLNPREDNRKKIITEDSSFELEKDLKNNISIIDVDNKSIHPRCKIPILNELISGIVKGGMEQASKAVSNLFNLIKQQNGKKKEELIEFLEIDDNSAEFILSLQEILRPQDYKT